MTPKPGLVNVLWVTAKRYTCYFKSKQTTGTNVCSYSDGGRPTSERGTERGVQRHLLTCLSQVIGDDGETVPTTQECLLFSSRLLAHHTTWRHVNHRGWTGARRRTFNLSRRDAAPASLDDGRQLDAPRRRRRPAAPAAGRAIFSAGHPGIPVNPYWNSVLILNLDLTFRNWHHPTYIIRTYDHCAPRPGNRIVVA